MKAQVAPKTYDDLLDPVWNEKITIERNYVDWFMTLMKHWGPEREETFFDDWVRMGLSYVKDKL